MARNKSLHRLYAPSKDDMGVNTSVHPNLVIRRTKVESRQLKCRERSGSF